MEAVVLFSMFLMNMEPNTVETDVLFKTNVETNDKTTDREDDFMSCCASETTDSEDDFMSCCDFLSRGSWHIWTHGLGIPWWEDRFRSI